MRVGVDLGGTKIEAVLMDRQSQVVQRERVPTPQGDYAQTLEALRGLVLRLEQAAGQSGLRVGIAHPGSISPATGLMRNASSVCLNGRSLKQDLEALLQREVRMANDADCLAVSEASDGAAAGADNVFAVVLGTGVGGGIAINRQLLRGGNGIVGEWGHNPMPWPRPEWGEVPGFASTAREAPRRPALDGRAGFPGEGQSIAMDGLTAGSSGNCWCGGHGCIETWLSGPALTRDHARVTGKTLSAEAIVQQAEAGDDKAATTLARYEDRLARALAHIINVLDPQVIVLGGGVSRVQRLYRHVPTLWDQWVFADRIDTRLVPALHGDSSGVRGAAWLWPD